MTAIAAEETYVPRHRAEQTNSASAELDMLEQHVKNVVHNEMKHFLDDIERRLAQTYAVAKRTGAEVPAAVEDGSVFVEDIVTTRHAITGYTVTANSPAAGQIAWTNVHVVYNGVDYTCTDGNALTTEKYVYFVKPGSGTTATLVKSATKPTATDLGVGGALLFINNGGTPISVLESSIPAAVGDGAIDSGALATGAVTAGKIFAGAVDSTALANNAVVAGKVANGAINAATQFGAGVVDSNALGNNAVVAGKVATGAINASTQIANGIVNTAQLAGNAVDGTKIAAGAVNTTQLAGNAVDSTKIAAGAVGTTQIATDAVDSTKIATGAVGTAELGANAVDSTKLADGAVSTSAKIGTGVVGATNLGAGAVTPVKLNTLVHMLY